MNSAFQMNQVLFPMLVAPPAEAESPEEAPLPPSGEGEGSADGEQSCRGMVGLILEHFADLDERIEFGKALYAMLFGYQEVLAGVEAFAANVVHRGSRQEYWPKLFTDDKKTALNSPQESAELLKREWLPPDKRLYSPSLAEVWHDMPYEPITRYDWFKSNEALDHLTRPKRPVLIEMSHAHRFAVQKAALTHDTERAVSADAAPGRPDATQ